MSEPKRLRETTSLKSTSRTIPLLPERFEETSVEACIFVVNQRHYALPLKAIIRILPAVATSCEIIGHEAIIGFVNVHGFVIPVCDFKYLIEKKYTQPEPDQVMILARAEEQQVILLVDTVLDVRTLHVLPLAPPFPGEKQKKMATQPVVICGFGRHGVDIFLYADLAPLAPLLAQLFPDGAGF